MTVLLCTMGAAPARPANRKGRPPTALRVAPLFGLHLGGAMSLELVQAARLLGFDAKAGWPLVLTADHLACLQTHDEAKDAKLNRVAQHDFRAFLELGLQGGELAHTTSQVLKKTTRIVRHSGGISLRSWDGGGGLLAALRSMDGAPARVLQRTEPVQTTCFNITAHDFCTWLQRHGMPPSALVADWFEAAEVDVQPVTAIAMATGPQHTKRLPQKCMASDWDGPRLLERQQEYKAMGLKDFTARVAKEAGLSKREVSRRIKAEVKPQSAAKRA